MRDLGILAALVLFLFVGVYHVDAKAAWNGDFISWVPWGSTLATAKREGKPVLMMVHKSWCPHCKRLEESVSRSAEFELLAEYFVMSSVEDDEEPTEAKYSIQGMYSPRVLFLHPTTGDVLDVVNEAGDPTHLHHYESVEALIPSMLRALQLVSGSHFDLRLL